MIGKRASNCDYDDI